MSDSNFQWMGNNYARMLTAVLMTVMLAYTLLIAMKLTKKAGKSSDMKKSLSILNVSPLADWSLHAVLYVIGVGMLLALNDIPFTE